MQLYWTVLNYVWTDGKNKKEKRNEAQKMYPPGNYMKSTLLRKINNGEDIKMEWKCMVTI